MKKHIERLIATSAKPLGTILYIGAGSGDDVSRLVSLSPKKLTVIESNPELFHLLEKKIKHNRFVELKNTWVFPNSVSKEKVCCFNNPRYNSIKTEKSLEMRNINLLSETLVTGLPLFSLLSESELNAEFVNILVIDTLEPSALLDDICSDTSLIEDLDFIILKFSRFSQSSHEYTNANFDDYYLKVKVDEPRISTFLLNRSFILKKSKEKASELNENVAKVKRNFSGYILKNKAEIKKLLDKVESLQCTISSKENEISELMGDLEYASSSLKEKDFELAEFAKNSERQNKKKDREIEELSNKLKSLEDLQKKNASAIKLNNKINLKLQSDISDLREKYLVKINEEKQLTLLITMLFENLKTVEQYLYELDVSGIRYITGNPMNKKVIQIDNALKSILTLSAKEFELISTEPVTTEQLLDNSGDLIEKLEKILEMRSGKHFSVKYLGILDDEKAEAFAQCLEAMPNVIVIRLFNGSFHSDEFESKSLNESIYKILTTNFGMKLANKVFLDYVSNIANVIFERGCQLVLIDMDLSNSILSEKETMVTENRFISTVKIESLLINSDVVSAYTSLVSLNKKSVLSFEEYCQKVHELQNKFDGVLNLETYFSNHKRLLLELCNKLNLAFTEDYSDIVSDSLLSLFNSKTTQADTKIEIDTCQMLGLQDRRVFSNFASVTKLVTEKKNKLVLVASIPRSGSTWMFNCIRLIFKLKNIDFYSDWYDSYDPQNQSPIHLVKLHDPEYYLASLADIVITTRRDVRNSVASLIRMKWLEREEDAIFNVTDRLVNFVHPFWESKSNLEVEYCDLKNAPESVISRVAEKIGLPLNEKQAMTISAQLKNLKPPKKFDTETQLHPNHRGESDTNFTTELSSDIVNMFENKFSHWLKAYGYL
ncbi:hypothetical protein [Alteromonas australica]|uniref:hypothetical protein n=1 Tax=Alteromonas australica TaxID=589873 RepID=UPI0035C7F1D5